MLVAAPVPVDAAATVSVDEELALPIQITPFVNDEEGQFFQGVVIQERVMIRVPATRPITNGFNAGNRRVQSEPRRVVWQERNAPRCVPMKSLVRVQFVQRDSLDLITNDRSRLRASLGKNCRSANFYSGFYVRAPKDGMMCAGREVVQSRSGASCSISRFQRLVPVASK